MVDFYHEPPERRGIPPENEPFPQDDDNDGLGPLPPKWEKAYTENGETYFIDHNSGTSHWLDPRLSKYQKKSLEECKDDELPYGWEKIQDPQYGTYFIDHVNRRTQYENPVLEAKRRNERVLTGQNGASKGNHTKVNPFTRNPAELQGEQITTTLLKSTRGLGFTIIGGDDLVDEFLQIKSIVQNGPAWLDGKLLTGDVLVFVNETCTLGFKHHEMVNVFQSILAGETVTLEVCRGYPLPFDPNDPNTEVVTTIAVDPASSNDPEKSRLMTDPNMDGNYNFLDMSDTPTSGPSTLRKNLRKNGGGSEENLLNDSKRHEAAESPQILNITITKGPLGFGFTIADSAYGQKVKKILDPNCCKDLQEGDYLLAINNTTVIYMPHNSVVQVLKSCPKSEKATLKIQRGQFYNGSLNNKSNRWRRSGDRFNTASMAKDTAAGMYRSKTPTADLYSTQPKEILPTRPKTPLVDTRHRAKTPSSELNGGDGVDSVQHAVADDRRHISADAKSNSSFPDQDSINNEVPHMDPFPKLVANISDRLADTSLNRGGRIRHPHTNVNFDREPTNFVPSGQEYYGNTSLNSAGIYSNSPNSIYAVASGEMPPKLPFLAPVPTYHHDHCYCYECQDYNRYQRENLHQRQQQYNQYVQMQTANGRMLKRINDGAMDRRKGNFTPMQILPTQSQIVNTSTAYVQQDEFGHVLTEITLERQAQGFGFRIVGGTEEGSQVTVGHIVPGGSADSDPRIATGDEILNIDGHNVVQASHHRVVQLMGEAGQRGYVTMVLRRRVQNLNPVHPQHHQHAINYPYDVMVARNEHEGFGFVIISASNQYYGSTIGKLIPGSPADRCGELKVGDRIIAVNHVDIAGMAHGDVVNLIKESGLYVRLTIGNPKESQNGGNGVGPGL